MSASRPPSIGSTAGPSSPILSPHSPPEVVLVNDTHSQNEELDFSSDDGLSDDVTAQPDRFSASVIPPLSPTLVLLYLSVPFRKMDIEDVILDVFARGSDKARTRLLLRIMVRVSTFVTRVLLASVSLRGSYIPPISSFLRRAHTP